MILLPFGYFRTTFLASFTAEALSQDVGTKSEGTIRKGKQPTNKDLEALIIFKNHSQFNMKPVYPLPTKHGFLTDDSRFPMWVEPCLLMVYICCKRYPLVFRA